jgi:hypothetical protein
VNIFDWMPRYARITWLCLVVPGLVAIPALWIAGGFSTWLAVVLAGDLGVIAMIVSSLVKDRRQ